MSDEDCLPRVARALCAADGKDPEEVVPVGSDEVDQDANGIGYPRVVRAPAWISYASEARRSVAAARAMGLME